MSNDLDVYSDNSELAPYAPSPLSPLAPSPDSWGQVPDVLTPREIADHQNNSGNQPQWFGQTLPGATQQQVTQTLTEISALISGDLMRLGHPQPAINAALSWFQNSARKTPARETKRHNFNLHDQAGDLVAESFGNAMAQAGATQEFVSNCLWLLGELVKRLGTSQGKPAPRTATSSNPLDQLSDAQYAQVVKANDSARAATMGYLQNLWGDSFEANLRMVDNYYKSLPLREQQALDQITTGWISSLNTKEVLLGLYKQAIGQHSIPSGGALSAEIAECERCMRTNRKQWLADDRLQARYRELLKLRDGR